MLRQVVSQGRVCTSKLPAAVASATPRQQSTLAPEPPKQERFLITGSCGQIGMDLIPFLRRRYGAENVVASDLAAPDHDFDVPGPFRVVDVTDEKGMRKAIQDYGITSIIHNASLLSAKGEHNPQLALKVNLGGLHNVLELARQHGLSVFSPSSIAAFGTSTPRHMTPDLTVMRPSTVYGITKVHTELLGEYYATRFNMDFRSLRYPGVLSSTALPGGGTTDYAIDIFYAALQRPDEPFKCFLAEDAELPMIYMPDLIRGTVQFLEAPVESLRTRTYNLAGLSFTPAQLYAAIAKTLPSFQIDYQPDFRQAIAESWPASLDDTWARQDWQWQPLVGDVDTLVRELSSALSAKFAASDAVASASTGTTSSSSPSTASPVSLGVA